MSNKHLNYKQEINDLERIKTVRDELYELINFYGGNMLNKDIIQMSQYLDRLLVAHTNHKKVELLD
ncbi:MAG: hypothetical protein K0R69_2397 [Clostridia bacterium]|jgi:arginine/lysine/ornithine decarboxylase|nr:hypothetical protein [Clostridia bacterium]